MGQNMDVIHPGNPQQVILREATTILRDRAIRLDEATAATTPKMVARIALATLSGLEHEECTVFLFNAHAHLVHNETMFRGTLGEVAIHEREIVKVALAHNSRFLVIAHNHPSGRCKPSDADLQWTKHLEDVCKPIGLTLLDHFIVTEGKVWSCGRSSYLVNITGSLDDEDRNGPNSKKDDLATILQALLKEASRAQKKASAE